MGQTGKLPTWSKPAKLNLVQHWRRTGYTKRQVAEEIGIDESTMYDWVKKSPQFAKALEVGSKEAKSMLMNVTYQKALKGDMNALKTWMRFNFQDEYRGIKESQRMDAAIKKLEEETRRLKLENDAITSGDVDSPLFKALEKLSQGDKSVIAPSPNRIEDEANEDSIQ